MDFKTITEVDLRMILLSSRFLIEFVPNKIKQSWIKTEIHSRHMHEFIN